MFSAQVGGQFVDLAEAELRRGPGLPPARPLNSGLLPAW